MGKRKKSSRKPQGPKKKESLDTVFPCLFCNHERSVTVKMDKKAGAGHATCKVCGQSFTTNVSYISAAVDVYADWVDAAAAVNDPGVSAGRETSQAGANAVRGQDQDRYEDEGIDDRGEIYADE